MEINPAGRVLGAILAGGLARRMGGGDKCLLPLAGRPILAHIVERLAPQCAALVLNANGDQARFAAFGLPVVADGVAGFAGPLAGLLTVLDFAAEGAWAGRSLPPGGGPSRSEGASRGGGRRAEDDRSRTHSTPTRLGLRPSPPSPTGEGSGPASDVAIRGYDSPLRNGGEILAVLTVPGDTPFLPRDLLARLAAARAAEGAEIACAASGGRLHPTVGLWPLALRDDLRLALAEGERSIGRFAARHRLAVVEWEGPDPFLNVNTPDDLAAAEAR